LKGRRLQERAVREDRKYFKGEMTEGGTTRGEGLHADSKMKKCKGGTLRLTENFKPMSLKNRRKGKNSAISKSFASRNQTPDLWLARSISERLRKLSPSPKNRRLGEPGFPDGKEKTKDDAIGAPPPIKDKKRSRP